MAVEGLALFRKLFDDDPEHVEARLGDIARFLDEADRPPLSLSLDFPERSVAEGYADWAGTYDTMPNGLIVTEQRIVEELLAGVAPGRALDAACGTGRLTQLLVGAGHQTMGVGCTPEMLA